MLLRPSRRPNRPVARRPVRSSGRRHRHAWLDRGGVATVEFAFILPVLITLTLGTMDLCNVIFLKEAVSIAAYEGARQGVNRNRTNADARARIIDFLDQRGIQYNSADVISISDPGFDNAAPLEFVTVTVRVPADGNVLVADWLSSGLQIEAACTLRKEFPNNEI